MAPSSRTGLKCDLSIGYYAVRGRSLLPPSARPPILHSGYLVWLVFRPSRTGGSTVGGLRHDSGLVLQPGMAFHMMHSPTPTP